MLPPSTVTTTLGTGRYTTLPRPKDGGSFPPFVTVTVDNASSHSKYLGFALLRIISTETAESETES